MCMCTRLLDKIILIRINKAVLEYPLETFNHNIAYKKGFDPRDIIALILDTLDLIKETKIIQLLSYLSTYQRHLTAYHTPLSLTI